MDITVWDFLLIVGASARLTRLGTVDTISEPARIWVMRAASRVGPRAGAWAAGLLGCPHCLGFWIAAAVTATWAAWGDTTVWLVVALTLTAAYVSGHIVATLDTDDEDDDDA